MFWKGGEGGPADESKWENDQKGKSEAGNGLRRVMDLKQLMAHLNRSTVVYLLSISFPRRHIR